jgi:hypothetical protein
LHVFIESERGIIDQRVEKDNNLNIFEMTTSTSEHATKLINRKLLIFKHYQVDVKNIMCLLQWWEKNESMFPTIGFYARQILRIVGSQIEIERIFFYLESLLVLVNVIHNLKIWTN